MPAAWGFVGLVQKSLPSKPPLVRGRQPSPSCTSSLSNILPRETELEGTLRISQHRGEGYGWCILRT